MQVKVKRYEDSMNCSVVSVSHGSDICKRTDVQSWRRLLLLFKYLSLADKHMTKDRFRLCFIIL